MICPQSKQFTIYYICNLLWCMKTCRSVLNVPYYFSEIWQKRSPKLSTRYFQTYYDKSMASFLALIKPVSRA